MTTVPATNEPYAGKAFEHDIFVSYSHGIHTESGEDSDLKIWTHTLIGKLKEHIGYSLENKTHPVNVWYDAKLAGNLLLTDTLKQKVEKSATLMVVMTDLYLESDWCQKEIDWFRNEINRRGGGVEHVFVVRAMATNNQKWPDFLKDRYSETVFGYSFFDETKGPDARPYGWVKPSRANEQFYDALTKLVSDIAKMLDKIRKTTAMSTGEDSEAAEPPESTCWPVLVAPGTPDVLYFIKDVRKNLKADGCTLLPPKETRIENLTEQDEEHALKTARVFIQCLGAWSAKTESSDIGRVQRLYQRAQENDLQKFLWCNRHLSLDLLNYDPEYKQFVESLGDIPEQTAAELSKAVVDHLTALEAEGDTLQELTAFMEVPASALSEFDRLRREILVEDCTLLPRKPPAEEKLKQINIARKTRQQIFQHCNAVLLIYYISDQLKWLIEAIIDTLKVINSTEQPGPFSPVPFIIDYVGEAESVGVMLGVDHIPWNEGSDPSDLWRKIRSLLL